MLNRTHTEAAAPPSVALPRAEGPLRVLDLNLLRVFDALLTAQSVSGAATRLSITPSAVSHALARLRHLLKDPLFVRGPRGMRATPRAAQIGPRLREGLHQIEVALTPVEFVPAESTRDFIVSCSSYVSAVLLPQVIGRMREEAPRAMLSVRTWAPGVVRDFDDRRIDVLIGSFGRIPDRFEFQPLFRDRPVWVLGRDYMLPKAPLDRANVLPRLALAQENSRDVICHAVTENGLERLVGLDDQSGIIGVPLGDDVAGPTLGTIPYSSIGPLIVKHPDIAALLPGRAAALFGQYLDLDLVAPEPALPEEAIGAVWHRGHGRHPALAWFRSMLKSVAAGL
jgi:DNA-binding transcriptional LysR family regulator